MIIHTEWNEYRGVDLNRIKRLLVKPIILDLRNIFNSNEMKSLGFSYFNIGAKKNET